MSKAKNFLIELVGLTASWTIIRFGENSVFKIVLLSLIFVSILGLHIRVKKSNCNLLFFLMYGCMFLTLCISVIFPVGSLWVKQEYIQFFWISVYAVFYLIASAYSDNQILLFFKGFTIGSIIQLVWEILQYLIYSIVGTDINMTFFSALYSRSYMKEGGFGASGLAWHPSNLAPLLIVLFWTTNNWYIKFVVLVAAILSNNSTVIICLAVCLVINIIATRKKKIQIKKKSIIFALVALIILVVLLFKTDLLSITNDRVGFVYQRLFGGYYDGGSTNAHIRYYTSIPSVITNFPLMKILFGFGEGCSGYVMTSLFGQYSDIGAWALECDIVNILWSKGIIGFVLFYGWLFSIIKRGWKINPKYSYILIAIMFGGIFYNIQYDWVIVLEIVMDIAIFKHIDLFSNKFFTKKRAIEKYSILIRGRGGIRTHDE